MLNPARHGGVLLREGRCRSHKTWDQTAPHETRRGAGPEPAGERRVDGPELPILESMLCVPMSTRGCPRRGSVAPRAAL